MRRYRRNPSMPVINFNHPVTLGLGIMAAGIWMGSPMLGLFASGWYLWSKRKL